MELLEVIENLREEDASVRRLFEGEGTPVAESARRISPERLVEAAEFIGEIESGKRPFHHMREAMTTSDFPLMFADIIDRQLLGYWKAWVPEWEGTITRVSTVPDFRNVKRFAVDGAEGALPEVKERAEYPETPLNESKDEFKVKKVGRRIDLSWETMINDDLDAFRRNPERLAIAGRRSEAKFVTELYVGASGPHASLYTSGHKNIVPANPALTIEGLQKAFQLLSEQVDNDGEPIMTNMITLCVPPALQIQAENILHATEIHLTVEGGSAGDKLIVNNWMRNKLRLYVDPYIPLIAKTANANTSWFLFSDPGTARPAIDFGRLRGHETPAIYERLPNARLLGGNGTAQESFEDDTVAWRIRHVFGGTQLNSTGGFKATVASNGTGS